MHTNMGTVASLVAGTVATPGTVTGTGIHYGPTFLPDAIGIVSMGAVTAGTATIHFQGGTAAGDGATSYGSIVVGGAAAGTQHYALKIPNVTTEYLRALVTVAGGTATVSAAVIATPRTVTE